MSRASSSRPARERLDEPKRAQAERPLLAHEPVRRLLDVVAEDEAACDQTIVPRRPVYGVQRAEHPGTFGCRKENQRHDQVTGV